MLEEPSVRHLSVSGEMIDWWARQVEGARSKQKQREAAAT